MFTFHGFVVLHRAHNFTSKLNLLVFRTTRKTKYNVLYFWVYNRFYYFYTAHKDLLWKEEFNISFAAKLELFFRSRMIDTRGPSWPDFLCLIWIAMKICCSATDFSKIGPIVFRSLLFFLNFGRIKAKNRCAQINLHFKVRPRVYLSKTRKKIL